MLFKLKHTLNEIDLGLDFTYLSKEHYVSETLKSIQFEKEMKEVKEREYRLTRTEEARAELKKDYIYSQQVKYGKESIKYIENLSLCGLKVISKLKKETKVKNDSLKAFIMLCHNYFVCLSFVNDNSTHDIATIEYHPEKIISYILKKHASAMKLKYHHLRDNELNTKERVLYSDLIKLIDFNCNHMSEISTTLEQVISNTLFDELHKQINNMDLEQCVAFRAQNIP